MGTFKNKNGGTFDMPTSEENEISVLEGGYLITRDGQFIPVKDNQDHSDVFTRYINLNNGGSQFYNTTEAITLLVNEGNIVYIGKKVGDDLRNVDGAFIFIVPDEEIGITENQRKALMRLNATNVSIFSKTPIVDLAYTHLDDTPANIDLTEVSEHKPASK